ncbi:MAG: FlgD immunoglobulin-like domain containing protein, partial [Gaiellaceae bacterium]
TEGLKLTSSPVTRTRVDKIFSPVCSCPTARAHIRFRIGKVDRLTLAIVDGGGQVVRTLVDGRRFSRGLHGFTWNGRDDSGALLADGTYRPRVHLAKAHRTILLPNPITLDAKAPTASFTARPLRFTPGRGSVKIRYRLSEPGHPLLYVDGRRAARGRSSLPQGKLDWFGTGLRAGRHRLTVAAVDLAGNVGKRTSPVAVTVTYIELARESLRVRAGGLLRIAYAPSRGRVEWRIAGRSGTSLRGRVVIRAPRKPGRYTLYVSRDGHADSASVLVRAAK